MNHSVNNKLKIVYSDGTQKVITPDNNTRIFLKSSEYHGVVENNIAYRYLRGDIYRRDLIEVENGIDIIDIMGRGDTPSIKKIDASQTTVGCNTHGVIMNVTGGNKTLGRLGIKPYHAAISNSIICLRTDSLEESKRLLEYLSSDEIKKIVSVSMVSFHSSKDLFRHISDLVN
jgi:hypothetical protein